jgi:hypothetical protein
VIAPLLAGVLAISAIAFAGSWSASRVDRATSERMAPRHLRIRGHLGKMRPGKDGRLRLRIRNPLGAPVGVYRVWVKVHRGSGPNGRCPARSLAVEVWRGFKRIRPGGARRIRVKVHMRRGAPNRCQGTRWPLTYHARAAHL